MKQLKSLSPESRLDVLDMDTRLLNSGASLLAPSVTALLNRSLFSSTLPKDWKLARVIPIYKGKGPKTEESNFRPISILGSLSMIIEREVQSQLLSYFIKHDLITIDQFALLKNHSTVTCLHRIIDDRYEAINEREYIMSCFFDVQKCFDSINHDILIKKLCMVYKAPNLPGLRTIWRTANNLYPLMAKYPRHKWSRPVYHRALHWGHSYFLSSLTIYHSILRMRIAIYLQTTVLYIQWVNQQMKPVELCKNLFSRQGSGSIITTFLLTSLKLYVC